MPEVANSDAIKVQLLVGKTVKVDASNIYFFGGKIKEEIIQGWGFTRYVMPSLGPLAGTLMAVNPSVPKVDKFVTIGGDPQLLRYNSRLPIVVYVPEDCEVRYKFWKAEPEANKAKQG